MINKERDKFRIEMERKYGYKEGWLNPLWGKVDFSIKYDFDRMQKLILEDVKIAIRCGRSPEVTEPKVDYLFSDDLIRKKD
jgi:DMSO/TMAO reductase YedYZ molybdopterin-dependent catalytic subunit